MSVGEEIRSEKVLAMIRAKEAERLEAEKQLPLHDEKPRWMRKDLPTSEQWTRDEKLKLAEMAEAYLKDKRNGQQQAQATETSTPLSGANSATANGADGLRSHARDWKSDPRWWSHDWRRNS